MAAGECPKRETIEELPEHVIRYQIFTRLPVKSLVRFKLVCKSWLSLLSDRKFAIEHYICCAMQNPKDYDCLVADQCITGLLMVSRHEETCILPSGGYSSLIGSIHGLICFRCGSNLWLWNPAIHRFTKFMFRPGMHQRWASNYWHNFGFGFDDVSNDYKVVVFYHSSETWNAFVYSSNSNTWSEITVPDNVFPTDYRKRIIYRPSTIVKDCPYWTSYYKHWSDEFVAFNVLKFETRSNEFKLLPEFQCKSGGNTVLVNIADRPTLMDYEQDFQDISVDVYSLDKEESGVWIKMYSIGAKYRIISNMVQGFKYGGEIVFYKNGIYSYYDHKTGTITPLPRGENYCVLNCYRYTPSLIFIKGMELDTPLVSGPCTEW